MVVVKERIHKEAQTQFLLLVLLTQVAAVVAVTIINLVVLVDQVL